MKKLISLLLCALMITSLSLTAFAAPASESKGNSPIFPASTSEPDAEVQAYCTTHSINYADPIVDVGPRVAIPGTGTCGQPISHSYRCRNCPYKTDPENKGYQSILSHNYMRDITSRCDGYTQYLTYGCSYGCGSSTVTTRVCPSAGHSGACRWLPF